MEEQGRGLGEKMFGFILGFLIGGFFGMLGMCLCVICRGSVKPDLLERDLLPACEESFRLCDTMCGTMNSPEHLRVRKLCQEAIAIAKAEA